MAEAVYATLHTNFGPIRLELFPNHAPKTVANFVELAEGTKQYADPRPVPEYTHARFLPDFRPRGTAPPVLAR